MNQKDRTILRDDISAIIRAHPCFLGLVPTVTYDVSLTIADEIMTRLLGGAYEVTPAGQDYLAQHRLALAGGRTLARPRTECLRDGLQCAHGYRVCSECDHDRF